MRSFLLTLAAATALTGCGSGISDAPSTEGSWALSLNAFDVHPACTGQIVFSAERGPDSQSVPGLQAGQTYVDGLWTCGDASGEAAGPRDGDSIDLAVVTSDEIWLRALVEVSDRSISGGGFRAVRE